MEIYKCIIKKLESKINICFEKVIVCIMNAYIHRQSLNVDPSY